MTESVSRSTKLAIVVAALGYFVDVYDLVLFSVLRVASLKDLGVPDEALLESGVSLLNMQLLGLVFGGIFWGILGDKRGRLSVLFGSIITYSLANIANAFVQSVESYALLRFIAGVGLAGELGAGVTLVSELMPKEKRGWGTTIISTVGVSGALVAASVGNLVHWRTSYIIGGVMGLALLILRVAVSESGLFKAVRQQNVERGNVAMIFSNMNRLKRFISVIFVGMPTWFAVGILMTFAPEIAKALGITDPILVSYATIAIYIGLTVGDCASGVFSQIVKSRKRALSLFIIGTIVCCGLLLTFSQSANSYYGWLIPIGFFAGYWCVFVTTAAEQFGTNLRATVSTAVPNLVRGSAVLMTLLFRTLIPNFGVVGAATIVGGITAVLALSALWTLRETFHQDLEYVET